MTVNAAKRILVIDDSEVVLARIKRTLGAMGYDVITTTQIVGNARHLPTCDLVVLDYHMPGLNGAAVVGSLRAIASSTKNICPIILYTSDLAMVNSHKELGFDGVFLQKGDEQALVRQVASLFRLIEIRAVKDHKP
jgi:two-component system OmpR family response regulator